MNKKLNGSITVEAAFSFTIMVFVLFLMIGPLLIIKTSSDIMIEMNEASKNRCSYEMFMRNANNSTTLNKIKDYVGIDDSVEEKVTVIKNIMSYALLVNTFHSKYDDSKSEYRNISLVYDLNPSAYDEDTGVVRYDYSIAFKLPYNLLHTSEITKRLLINRRAFIGSVGDRFNNSEENGDYVYVANNYINSSVYHTYKDCTYLIKKVTSCEYRNMGSQRNESNQKYTKCNYCFKKIRLTNDTLCYITEYGDRFHYRNNCPLMTAYVTKIPKEYVETYNLRKCSRCGKR